MQLIGTPYRRGGRDPAHGLDCIGLVCHALEASGRPVPRLPPYRMRNLCIERFCLLAENLGLRKTSDDLRSGDILVLQPSCAQFHLAIAVDANSAVHAHAGLRQITFSPLPMPWPTLARWRLAEPGDMPWPHSS